MAIANINWTFGPRSSVTPIARCAITVLVARDGVAVSSFVMTTDASGAASGIYQDLTASATDTHQYRFVPQDTGCAGNCTIAPVIVNWNCAGTAPIAPADTPPSAPGCPDVINSVTLCGGTAPIRQVAVGGTVALSQQFRNAATVTVTPAVPGLTATSTYAGGALNGVATTTGSYSVQFKGSNLACADCITTYPLVVGDIPTATQSIRIVKGSSAYTPVSATSFNAADQIFEATLVAPPGKTFQLQASGTVSVTSPVITMPATGTFTYSPPVGQFGTYSTAWAYIPAGSNPISLTNPGTTTITGSTCVTLSVTQLSTYTRLVVTAPVGAIGVPITLSFGGASFAGSNPTCVGNNFGVINNLINTNSGGTGNVLTFDLSPIVAPYSAAIKLDLRGASLSTHVICGQSCYQVSYI